MEGFEDHVEESVLRNICGACLLDIDGSSGKHEVLALLDCCRPKHIFHPMCIHTWSDRENSCPQCKQRFRKYATYGGDGKILRVQPVEDRSQRYCPTDADFANEVNSVGDEEPPPVWDVCPLCHSAEDEASLLLCDGLQQRCPAMYHFYCLGLSSIPEGDWFCPSCHAGMRAEVAGETLARMAEDEQAPLSDSDSSWSVPSTEAGATSEESEEEQEEDEEESREEASPYEPSSSSTSRPGMEAGSAAAQAQTQGTKVRRRLRPATATASARNDGEACDDEAVGNERGVGPPVKPGKRRPKKGKQQRRRRPRTRQRPGDHSEIEASDGSSPARPGRPDKQKTRKKRDNTEEWRSRLRTRRRPTGDGEAGSDDARAAKRSDDNDASDASRACRAKEVRRLQKLQRQQRRQQHRQRQLVTCQSTKQPPLSRPGPAKGGSSTRRAVKGAEKAARRRRVEGKREGVGAVHIASEEEDVELLLDASSTSNKQLCASCPDQANPFSWAERISKRSAQDVCIDLTRGRKRTLSQSHGTPGVAERVLTQKALLLNDGDDAPLKTLVGAARRRAAAPPAQRQQPLLRQRQASGRSSSGSSHGASSSSSSSSCSSSFSVAGLFSTESSNDCEGDGPRSGPANARGKDAATRKAAVPNSKEKPPTQLNGRSEQKAIRPGLPPGAKAIQGTENSISAGNNKVVVEELLKTLGRIVEGRLATVGTEVSKRTFNGLSPGERDLRVTCLKQRIGALAASKYKPGFERETRAWVRTLNSPKGELRIVNFVNRQVAEALQRWQSQAERPSLPLS